MAHLYGIGGRAGETDALYGNLSVAGRSCHRAPDPSTGLARSGL